MIKTISFATFSLLALLSGCAFAPISTNTTARTLGGGHVEIQGGATGLASSSGLAPVAEMKLGVGVFDSLDLGFQYEVLSTGLFAKYALINNPMEGGSLAVLGGFGSSGTGSYWYAGPILSYKAGAIEPYAQLRYNSVYYSATTTNLGSLGTLDVPAGNYSYLMGTLGLALWPTHWLGLSAEGTLFGTSELTRSSPMMFSGAIMLRL